MENKITLMEAQGIIATCAIENSEHDKAYKRISELIEKYGLFTRVDWNLLRTYCYRERD